MKASEFYEKYVTVNGKPVKPLTDAEKEFLDNAAENKNCEQVIFIRKRKGNLSIGVKQLNKMMENFPEYMKPQLTTPHH